MRKRHIVERIIIAALFLELSMTAAEAAIISNGSFESGNFDGWGLADIAFPYRPLTVRPNGYNSGFFTTQATDGVFSATHGFDGIPSGVIRIFQDIGAVDTSSRFLEFDYRASWFFLEQGGLDRTFSLNVYQAGTFNLLSTNEVLRALGGSKNLDTGSLGGRVDLSPFNGQNVRISFDAVIPEPSRGPGFLQLDHVRLTSVPELSSLTSFGLATFGIFLWSFRTPRKMRKNSDQTSQHESHGLSSAEFLLQG